MLPDYLTEMRKFVAPEFVFGLKAIDLVGQYAHNLGMQRVLLVTDPGVMKAGWAGRAQDSLSQSGIAYHLFDRVTPNPRDAEVREGVAVYRDRDCDSIVAVGGGSPMDCAKGIGIVAAGGGDILNYEGVDQVEVAIPPLICVPTTAGSSADVSQFCIITDTKRKVKIAIVSKAVVPDVALIDPETTTTMDAYLTACTGLDALTHAIEAYVSNANSPITDLHALSAIRLIPENLPAVIADPNDLTARSNMMLASLQAGLAFSNAILGAVHAMAHSLGGLLDLPHGECNAILLEHVVAYNLPAAESRYRVIAEALGISDEEIGDQGLKDSLLRKIVHLRQSVGVSRSLADLGVEPKDLAALARNAALDSCLATNPREAGPDELKLIYECAL